MKKISLLFFFFAFNLAAFAQEMTCLDKLLPYNRNSGLHLVTRDEWTDGKEVMDADTAKNAIRFLVNEKLICKVNEVVIKVQPICSTIIADLPQSNTCFAFTNLGYFVISRDNARNMSFIFGRDKRFSDPTPTE